MNSSQPAIQIKNLHQSFGKKKVLNGVNLEIPSGSIFGFLGLNGMGKTTLIRTLLGLQKPDEGSCLLNEIDPCAHPIEVRKAVGYMAENQTMYGWMTVSQIIQWVACFYPNWDEEYSCELLQKMKLDPNAKVENLSKGQTSQLALLLALSHHPQIVILDDPTLGLDPLTRKNLLREIISQLQEKGVTVFFSSHLLYEMEPVCDRVAILHEGRIVSYSTVDDLREKVKRVLVPRNSIRLEEIPGLLDIQTQNGHWALTIEDFSSLESKLKKLTPPQPHVVDLNLDEIFEAYVSGRKELPHE